MQTEQPTKCFLPFQKLRARLAPLNRFKPTPVVFIISDRSKAVLLISSSVFACFGVSFCTVYTFCVSR